MIYELTLRGYDGAGYDEAEHLIKWIKADCRFHVGAYAESLGLTGHSIAVAPLPSGCDIADGVDVVLASDGSVARLAPGCNPLRWMVAHLPNLRKS